MPKSFAAAMNAKATRQLPWLGESAGLSASHHVGGLATGAEDAPESTAPGGRIDATPQSSMGSAASPERQLFWLAVWGRSKVVPLMASQYRLARWPYGTKGLKKLRVGTAGRGT
jgi:hypothetical protein